MLTSSRRSVSVWRRVVLAVPAAAVVAGLIGSPLAAASPVVNPQPSPTVAPAPATSTQIIMRDGGVCDPIRHMGC